MRPFRHEALYTSLFEERARVSDPVTATWPLIWFLRGLFPKAIPQEVEPGDKFVIVSVIRA